MRDVMVFPSPAKPAKRSLLVFGANDNETSFDPVSDLAASAIVRARNNAVVVVLGALGAH
jgi:hypothetical protein